MSALEVLLAAVEGQRIVKVEASSITEIWGGEGLNVDSIHLENGVVLDIDEPVRVRVKES
jgi:hypothetical protein